MFEIRRVLTHVEDIFHEFGPPPAHPLRRGTLAAVMKNPFAGRYEPEIQHAMELLKPIGVTLAGQLLAAMAVPHSAIEGYGKGAIIGAAGELEHGALWHVPGGYAMRELLEKNGVPTNAIVPSAKKVGAPTTALDVPMTHVNASYVRSHFDAIEVRVPGAPAADEIVYILAMSTGQRVHARVGGLAKEAIAGKDGLR
ncbi:amino acid synthesis family protein [Paraburkholderia acidicola]|uniref:Amino acid synthesis family protein n=1 Tax=Paraburkholderia acidicola TaxID=1912599 RepID=A0ABV1LY16_9BURK